MFLKLTTSHLPMTSDRQPVESNGACAEAV